MMIGMLGVPITIFHALLDLTKSGKKKIHISLYLGYAIYLILLYLNFAGRIVERAWFEENSFNYKLADGAILAYSLSYLFLIFALIHLTKEIRKADSKSLQLKLMYPIFGVIILLVSVLVNLYEPIGKYPIDLLGTTVNAILIFYSIYNYKLMNYSYYVLNGILFFILAMASSAIFYTVLWILTISQEIFKIQSTLSVSVILGVLAALIFQPVRKGSLSIIEKLYFGDRFRSFQDLKNFSDSLNSIVDLNTLGELTTKKIRDSYQLNWSAMLVLDYSSRNFQIFGWQGLGITLKQSIPFEPEGKLPMEELMSERSHSLIEQKIYPPLSFKIFDKSLTLTPSLILPLKFNTRTNGYLLLGESEERGFYNQMELETLEILSGHCSVSLENAITFERLKNQQLRLQDLNRELTVSRNKLEAFFDGITTPISIQDINYNIVMVNFAATKYFHTSYDELVGKKCYRVFFQREKPCEKCMAQDCLHTQLPFAVEQRREQNNQIFDVHFYPIAVPAGEDKLFLEFFLDITQQKKLQAELIQSEKLAGIGTLASGIAHEINNPLGGILGTAEIMKELLEPDTQLYEYTSDIIQYSETAASVIKDLTSYSRKEKGEIGPVDINMILGSALRLAQRGMDFSRVIIEKDMEELPEIEVNQNGLQQVFMNLIVNAVQSMPSGGTLSITSQKTPYSAKISIKDTGIGIEKEHMEDIFDPFYTTKEPGRGTGLGLSITHQIVTEMGGRIHINSEYKLGTEILVSLPMESSDKSKIRFVNVKEPSEREDVFFIQRKILVGEMGYREETIRREIDEKAYHILAYKGLQPVGTVSCITTQMIDHLPIEDHFEIDHLVDGKRCAEIDRLAVLKEERGSIISMGLMTLAYLYARIEKTERLFLDVFADDQKQVGMYYKLGFQRIGIYSDPSPVEVMILDHKTEYERKKQRMEQFVKPLMSRLVKLLDFDKLEEKKFLIAVDELVTTAGEEGGPKSPPK
jgi:PAS domain S-box-containing protein